MATRRVLTDRSLHIIWLNAEVDAHHRHEPDPLATVAVHALDGLETSPQRFREDLGAVK